MKQKKCQTVPLMRNSAVRTPPLASASDDRLLTEQGLCRNVKIKSEIQRKHTSLIQVFLNVKLNLINELYHICYYKYGNIDLLIRMLQ